MRIILRKMGVTVFLLLLAFLIAGGYGSLHNQFSSTVSPEYFTQFKYEQFGIPPALPLPIGAALVGFLASWWMGFPIGILLSAAGWFAPDARTMVRETLCGYGIVVIVSVAVGLCGFLCGVVFTTLGDTHSPVFLVPDSVTDRAAFLRAGFMHDASYGGGVLGMLLALFWQKRQRTQRNTRTVAS